MSGGGQSLKQKQLIYLLIAIVIAAAGVYFFYVKKPAFISSTVILAPNPAGDQNSQLTESLKSVNLNFTLLNDKKFQMLVLPGDFPVVVGEKGRLDPFAPF